MGFTSTCIICEEEGAYFNGLNYECPDCGSEWNANGKIIRGDDSYEEEDETLNELMALKEPYFKLNHGKLYNCKVELMKGNEQIIENITIVPLAFEKDKNRLFVLIEGEKWCKEEPEAIANFAKMDFTTIWNDGIYGYFETSSKMPISIIYATTEEGTLIDESSVMYDFIEVK